MAITSIQRDWGVSPCIVRITTTDALAAITTNGYFATQSDEIEALNNGAWAWVEGDLVAINYSNGEGFFTYSAADDTFVAETIPGSLSDTLIDGRIFVGSVANVATGVAVTGDIELTNAGVTAIAAGAIVNADVNAAAAIAFSKLAALPSAEILVGSAGNAAAAVAMTGDATISNTGAVTVNAAFTRTVSVAVSAAEVNGMFAAPKLLLAAPAAGSYHRVHDVTVDVDYGGVQFANGGAILVQYDDAAEGAGHPASAELAAATLNGYVADSVVGLAGALATATATAVVAQGLYLTNKTGAFDTGTSDLIVHVTYTTLVSGL